MLTSDQHSFYRQNGYVVVPDVLTPDEIAQLRRVTDDFIEQSRSVTQSDGIFDLEDNHTAENPRLRRIKQPGRHHAAYADMITHPRLVSILQQVVSPDLRFFGLKLNLKPGRGGEPIEWHQDWAYFPHTNDDIAILAMMIDDVTEENGPMQVVPGSHKGLILDHHQDGFFAGAITDPGSEATISKAVPLTGPAGSISIHHVRTLHASSFNHSDNYRRLLFITARAADAWPLAEAVDDINAFDDLMIAGSPTIMPRLVDVPVRMPFPRILKRGESIFEKQKGVRFSAFRNADNPGPDLSATATLQ